MQYHTNQLIAIIWQMILTAAYVVSKQHMAGHRKSTIYTGKRGYIDAMASIQPVMHLAITIKAANILHMVHAFILSQTRIIGSKSGSTSPVKSVMKTWRERRKTFYLAG
jgi:hypothetical protein